MSVTPDITVLPGQIHWFDPYRPRELLGDCTHFCFHTGLQVAAWGPSLALYELVECLDCGCRAWRGYGIPSVILTFREKGQC